MTTWTRHMEGGPRKVNHAAVAVGEDIYSFGGYCTGEDFTVERNIEVYKFDTTTYSWSLVTYSGAPEDIPYQRYGHTAVAFQHSCIIYGGRNDVNGVSEHIYRYDVATATWHRPVVTGFSPLARDGHSCCVVNDTMYMFAGFEEVSVQFSNTIYALNLITYQWFYCDPTGTPPWWRDFHSATPWKHYMIVFGGRSDASGPAHTDTEEYDNGVYMFDTVALHWSCPTVSGDIPDGRRSHCAFECHGKLYVFGGYNGILKQHYNDLHAYEPEMKTWTLCDPHGITRPRNRRRACCVMIHSEAYLFGGTSPQKNLNGEELADLSDLHVLDMAPTLKTLCMMSVLKNGIKYDNVIPKSLVQEVQTMAKHNLVSRVPRG